MIVGVLGSLLVIVPLAFGDRLVSSSFELHYPSGNKMDVVYVNGSVAHISMVSFMVSGVNSYFLPVYVHYNGFEVILLIYNRTVAEPADVAKNKEFLMWGAFWSKHSQMSPVLSFGENVNAHTAYEYYVARRDLSNYTKQIPVSGFGGFFIGDPSIDGKGWYGQNSFSNKPVPPGIYYIYCIAFGQITKPLNLTITSILWT